MKISVKQLLLLNNLVYLEPEEGPFPDFQIFAGKKVRDWMNAIDLSQITDDEIPRMTTAREWKNLIKAAKRDYTVMEMRILSVDTDMRADGGAGKSIVFISPENAEAIILFKGTELVAGSAQWKDNFLSGNTTDTPHQLHALEWYRAMCKKYHLSQYEVTDTGHSKGGNKAKYITILDDTVDHCVSFNGEGFSDLFFNKYGVEIVRNAGKIENHMVDYDYISPLLNDIGKAAYYHGHNFGIGGFTENHLANTFMHFGENGNFTMDVNEEGKPAEMLALDEFANSYLRSMEDDEKSRALDMLNDLLNAVLSVDRSTDRNEIVDIFAELAQNPNHFRHMSYMLAYLIRYEQEYPFVVDLLNNLLTRFGMEGFVQYVEMVRSILGWKKRILWLTIDFDKMASTISKINAHAPKWVYKSFSENLEKRGLSLSTGQIGLLADMVEMIDGFRRSLSIYEDGIDKGVHESAKEYFYEQID